jgi:hypothetical protein
MVFSEAVMAHLRSGGVSRVVYGSIIGLALIVALQLHPPAAGTVIVSLVATGVAVALAELYSDVIGARTRSGLGVDTDGFGTIAGDAGAVAFGICFPAIFFILSLLGAWDVDTAFNLAKWSGLALIATYGFVAGRIGGGSIPRALLEAFAVALIGAALIAVKALLH